ncbi:MAG: VOC family protein [Ignavibacteria bacterium]
MTELAGKLKMHHVGCAVKSIADSINTYVNTLGFNNVSPVYELTDVGINACFVELNNGVFLELIESTGAGSIVDTYLKKGMSYYHIGYMVNDIDSVVKELLNKDFREISSLYSPAFNNRKCVFMYTPELQMIELIDSD